MPGEACSGLASGFGSIWVPICGKKPQLVRVDTAENGIAAMLPISPAGAEGGITTSEDSVWMVTDKNGPLIRIDPSSNSVRQRTPILPGSYNPWFSDGVVWITGIDKKECGVGFDVCCESDLDDVVDSMECFVMPSAQRGASRLEECAQDYHVGTLCNCV